MIINHLFVANIDTLSNDTVYLPTSILCMFLLLFIPYIIHLLLSCMYNKIKSKILGPSPIICKTYEHPLPPPSAPPPTMCLYGKKYQLSDDPLLLQVLKLKLKLTLKLTDAAMNNIIHFEKRFGYKSEIFFT